jgi:hypothetical protein
MNIATMVSTQELQPWPGRQFPGPPPTCVIKDVVYPEIPQEWLTFDPALLKYHATLPGPEETGSSEEGWLRQDFQFGLQNRVDRCYRNVTLQCLLHNPVFYNWLIGHVNMSPSEDNVKASDDCLTCRLRDVAKFYYPPFGNRAELYNKLDAFDKHTWDEFWGPRSRLAKQGITIGLPPGKGNKPETYTAWLLYTLLKQKHVVNRNGVSEHGLLKRIFWTTIISYRMCEKGHEVLASRDGENMLLMIRKNKDNSVSIDEGLKNLSSQPRKRYKGLSMLVG